MYIVVQFWLDAATENLAGVSLLYQSTDKEAALSAYEECCEIERAADFRPIPEPFTTLSIPMQCGSTMRQMHIISDNGSYVVSIALLQLRT